MHTLWLIIHRPCSLEERSTVIEAALTPFYEDTSSGSEEPQWDWYQIGGRWTGLLDGYDAEKDPANLDANGEPKWPTTRRERAEDTQPVQNWPETVRPYWLLTPDGKILGCASEQGIADVAWPNWHRSLRERWDGFAITVMDCHR